jgi:hypothetical protein
LAVNFCGFSEDTGTASLDVGYGFSFVRADVVFGLRGVFGFHRQLVIQFSKDKNVTER